METLQQGAEWIGQQISVFFSGFVAAALMGRLAWHTRLVSQGKRRLFGAELVYELPIIGLAWYCGVGVGAAFQFSPSVTGGICSVLGYFGPGGVQAALQGYAKFRGVDVDLKGEDK